jgi:hypothetical protein
MRSTIGRSWWALIAALSTAPALAPVCGDTVSKEARASAELGLGWLLRAQNNDGSWGREPGAKGEVGNTSVATLCLMAHGSTPTRGPHCTAVRRGFDWLARRTQHFNEQSSLDRGTLLQTKLGVNADLYFVTLLYAQSLALGLDKHEDEVRQRELSAMVRTIAGLQKENGEWETSYEPMLTTICAWLALKQASGAGIAIEAASPRKAVRYLLEDCLERESGVFREAKWGRAERFVTQAGAVRVLHGEGLGARKEVQRAAAVIADMKFDQDVGGRTGGEEFLGALFATQALFIERDEHYAKWYPVITNGLQRSQNRDGSWQGHHCITDRVFCTACSVMTLLVPDKLVPMSER